jgi:glycosyltransferase involved in cell wall biosynthesis
LSKIKIYHFHNGSGGGVLSVIKNLLRFSVNENIENHIIYAVNKKLYPEFKIAPIEGAVTQQLYHYSSNNNFYFTCKKLAKLLPNENAIIVAHDWIELGMVGNLGLQNKVVQIVHGNYEYYYDLAQKHEQFIDSYICISPKIFSSLQEKLPSRKDDIFQLNFPVPNVNTKNVFGDCLNLFYAVGNLKDDNKQFKTIVDIVKKLGNFDEKYFFTIVGGGLSKEEFDGFWPSQMKTQVEYLGHVDNDVILNILPKQDIFLLPSVVEGLPVSLVEAMKAGVVPLITNWAGAVDELVTPAQTGYYFEVGAVNDYVECIKALSNDRKLLKQISDNTSHRANTLFAPIENTQKFEDIYIDVLKKVTPFKEPVKVYGSRLDQPWLANIITNTIRNLF